MTTPTHRAAHMLGAPIHTNEPGYVIRSFGSQSNALVLDPNDYTRIAFFSTRKAARAYADEITPCQPSKYLPLRVQKVDARPECAS
jgi:hypothetical protein